MLSLIHFKTFILLKIELHVKYLYCTFACCVLSSGIIYQPRCVTWSCFGIGICIRNTKTCSRTSGHRLLILHHLLGHSRKLTAKYAYNLFHFGILVLLLSLHEPIQCCQVNFSQTILELSLERLIYTNQIIMYFLKMYYHTSFNLS